MVVTVSERGSYVAHGTSKPVPANVENLSADQRSEASLLVLSRKQGEKLAEYHLAATTASRRTWCTARCACCMTVPPSTAAEAAD